MIPATNDLVCEWLKVKWCRTQVKNPISVFQIKKKREEFNSEARGTLNFSNASEQYGHLLNTYWTELN
jgi:hypothetical protein